MIDLGEKIIYDGVCSLYPEYALLIISIKKGLTKNIEDYYKLTMAINLPLIIAATHLDLCEEEDVDQFIYDLKKLINKNSQYLPFVIKNEKDVVLASKLLQKEKIIPIFLVLKNLFTLILILDF